MRRAIGTGPICGMLMPADFLAWSHSRLKVYRDCPKQLYHTQVAKKGHPDRVDFVQTPATIAGNLVDDALTKRISSGTPLPPQYAPYEDMVQAVLAAPGQKITQMKLALDRSFKTCGYMDWDNAWVRVIYDVAVINKDRAFLGDWKNGQIWLDEEQLRLFATVGFHYFPEVNTIDTSYIWLRHGVTSDRTYHRRELPELWQTFLPDVERMQIAFKNQHWPATPSKRACKFCPVNQAKKCGQAEVPYGGK